MWVINFNRNVIKKIMKDKILEIIDIELKESNYNSNRDWQKETAKSIESLIKKDYVEKEFVLWKDNFTEYDIENELYTVEVETHVIVEMTFNEVYQYWYRCVRK